MKATELLKLISTEPAICYQPEVKEQDIDINKITVDSREVEKGTAFFCLKGEKSDGHNFIEEAFFKGAALIVGEKEIDNPRYVKVSSVLSTLKSISSVFYGEPHKKLKMIGITGTNGKTTTSYMIENGLQNVCASAVIGTLGYKLPGEMVSAPNTTPFIWKWYELLAKMAHLNVNTVISEVSSHGLDQERIYGTEFDVAVFTNLTRDHLDYHKDIETYYNAKKKLFTRHLKKEGRAVINIDCKYGKRLYDEMAGQISLKSVSLRDVGADLYVEVKEETHVSTLAVFNYKGMKIKSIVPMIGLFNVYNAACAVMSCEPFAGFEKAVEDVCRKIIVPGRMEMVGNRAVYIDYAHTPDALENILSTAKNVVGSGRLIVVFGAGGDRDKGKRPEMGRIVSEKANIAIITDDNPRTETPEDITAQIKKGCSDNNCLIKVIHDRRTAIRYALGVMEKDDIVVIAGKGAENYQISGSEKRYFSDRDEVEKYFQELVDV